MALNTGTGSFVWTDKTGASDPNKSLRVYYYRPNVVNANTPVWVIMHGDSRNANDYRDYFVAAAQKQGAIVIAPEFSESAWPNSSGYNLGNISVSETNLTPKPQQQWSFSKIEPLFD
jgi:poly(3-hydroxybutyrate) depolymerase